MDNFIKFEKSIVLEPVFTNNYLINFNICEIYPSLTKFSADKFVCSKSFAKRPDQPNHANVRSTIQRLGRICQEISWIFFEISTVKPNCSDICRLRPLIFWWCPEKRAIRKFQTKSSENKVYLSYVYINYRLLSSLQRTQYKEKWLWWQSKTALCLQRLCKAFHWRPLSH